MATKVKTATRGRYRRYSNGGTDFYRNHRQFRER